MATRIIISFVGALLFLTSCNTSRSVQFSNTDWKYLKETGCIVSSDSAYRFIIGDKTTPSDVNIFGHCTQADDGIRKYIGKICKASKMKIDSVLCYIPETSTIIATTSESRNVQPSSVTTNIHDNPCTTWIRDDDSDEGKRADDEIYSNSLIDKRNKALIVIDRMTYNKQSIAFIKVIQTDTRKARKLNVPNAALYWADVTNPRNIDAISYWIMSHRDLAIRNFKLGNK